jgi:hypothetical protein
MSSHGLIGFDMSRLYPIDDGLWGNPAVLARLGNGEYIHGIIENTKIIDIIKNADCQAKKWKRFGVGGIKKGGDPQDSPP